MKENELRIGNLVYGNSKKVAKISLINNEHGSRQTRGWYIDGNAFGASDECLSPIPLTEEWLLRFGFERKFYEASQTVAYKKWLISISFDTGGISIGLQRISDKAKELKVHQLQNIYFALTGDELKITT